MAVTDDAWTQSQRRGTGWLSFAAALLVCSGIFKVFDAIWAFKYDDDIPEDLQTVLFEDDLAAWGWVWLILGAALIAAGFGVVKSSQWARWFGIVAASLAAIVNYTWIFVQPLWAIINVTLAVLVIYGLAAHGGRSSEWGERG